MMELSWLLDPEMDANLLTLISKEKTQEIENIRRIINDNLFKLTGKNKDTHYSLLLADCIRFYTENKKVFVSCADTEFEVSYRIYELEQQLPQNFVKISQSEIINLNFVKNFQLTKSGLIAICLKGNKISYSSRRYLKKVKEALV